MKRPVDWVSYAQGFFAGTLFGATFSRKVLLALNRFVDAVDVLLKGRGRS